MELDDAALIQQYKQGNALAFETLVRKYQRPLFTFLFRFAGNQQIAEDLFQETFLKILRALPNYNEQGKFSSWLFGIANNLAVDILRKKRLRNQHFVYGENALTQYVDRADKPDVDFEKKEMQQMVHDLLQELSERQRQVFLLRQHGEMTFKEIAKHLDQPLNTVLSHMNYAVKKLRRRLQISA